MLGKSKDEHPSVSVSDHQVCTELSSLLSAVWRGNKSKADSYCSRVDSSFGNVLSEDEPTPQDVGMDTAVVIRALTSLNPRRHSIQNW